MTNEECFEAWAPTGAAWSPWAKPVLFTHLLTVAPAAAPDAGARDLLWLPPADGRTVLLVDLPGVESVTMGLTVARRGYRPVPLYNTSVGPSAIVNAEIIASHLASGAETLRGLGLRDGAPPAFLLDSMRMTPSVLPGPGTFDNRWVVFPQDFPSGTLLRSRGVADALLIHGTSGLQDDLAHVLLRWQHAGIRILAAGPEDTAGAREVVIKPPSLFRRTWYRLLIAAGLRRNNAGGFGAAIPFRTTGGYG